MANRLFYCDNLALVRGEHRRKASEARALQGSGSLAPCKRGLAHFTIAVLMGGCSDFPCGNQIIKEETAPDGRTRAVLFQRDCGATTAFSTQISILKIGEALSGPGNVFVADTNHGAAAATDWGGPWADARWLSPSDLLITHDEKARIFKSEYHQSSINVTFEKIKSARHDPKNKDDPER
jgi:hypothetical protein